MSETDKSVVIDSVGNVGKFSNGFSVGYVLHNLKKAMTENHRCI